MPGTAQTLSESERPRAGGIALLSQKHHDVTEFYFIVVLKNVHAPCRTCTKLIFLTK